MDTSHPKYFGTDGIRGAMGVGCMTEAFLRRLGYALGRHLRLKTPHEPVSVQIGGDTRKSTPQIVDWLTEGLNACDIYVHKLGVVPTPAVPLAVRTLKGKMGVSITASHNPWTDNGVKLFDENGLKLEPSEELAIESLVDAEPAHLEKASGAGYDYDGSGHYAAFASSLLDEGALKGRHIVLDTANGATSFTTPKVFQHLGASLTVLSDSPNGENINRDCGSEHPEHLAAKVVETRADIGFAHDGDGDRLVVVDREGTRVDGDKLLGMLALWAFEKLPPERRVLVTTVQSNLGLDHAVEKAGGRVERVAVGDRNVLHRMIALNAPLGGENSGHIILGDLNRCGDGLLAALRICQILATSKLSLAQWGERVPLFPQKTANVRVKVKRPIAECPHLSAAIADWGRRLADNGRVMVRYSGTEPKIRLLVEADNAAVVEAAMGDLKAAVACDLETE